MLAYRMVHVTFHDRTNTTLVCEQTCVCACILALCTDADPVVFARTCVHSIHVWQIMHVYSMQVLHAMLSATSVARDAVCNKLHAMLSATSVARDAVCNKCCTRCCLQQVLNMRAGRGRHEVHMKSPVLWIPSTRRAYVPIVCMSNGTREPHIASCVRAAAENPVAKQLLNIMETKKTNLCVAAGTHPASTHAPHTRSAHTLRTHAPHTRPI
jgi:hypothetical protein